jgi:hypothetical protein
MKTLAALASWMSSAVNASAVGLASALSLVAGCSGAAAADGARSDDGAGEVLAGGEAGEGTGAAAPNDGRVGTTHVSFDAFEATVFREPDTGVYIVNGDTPVDDVKKLREFYERFVQQGALIVDNEGGQDSKWSNEEKRKLTYCVSDAFGARKAQVLRAMAVATEGWSAIADVNFVYVPSQDANCSRRNPDVLFDVSPVDVGGQYLARAFFPGQNRATRSVLVDTSSFQLQAPLTLEGILRHELGHALGFRHEHTRTEAGRCFEDTNWRALTPYDSRSVMHYPQCNGQNSWALEFSQQDAVGVAALYGAPRDPSQGGNPPGGGGQGGGGQGGGGSATGGSTPGGGSEPAPLGEPATASATGKIAAGDFQVSEAVSVVPGTTLRVALTGTGDADLYVRFGAAPTLTAFDCRPYRSTSEESCTLTVPEGQSRAFFGIRGYTASEYSLRASYMKPATPAGGGTTQTKRFTGAVVEGRANFLGPFNVAPGTVFEVAMAGRGDADLYVRFGADPTRTQFDCRPYLDTAYESCRVVVPAGATRAHVAVDGATDAEYEVAVRYVER